MGIMLTDCEIKSTDYSTLACLSARIIFSINILIIFPICYQIYLRVKLTGKKFSRKMIILYLLLLQPIVNSVYTGIKSYIQFYYADIYMRNICFTYLIYFFLRKTWLIGENPSKISKGLNLLFFIGLSLYYTILFFFAVFYKEPGPFCRDEYWTFLRIAGISMTFFFLIIGFILWKQYKAQLSGIIADFLENLKQYDEEIIQNNELANEYINYFNKTVIKLDEKMEIIVFNAFSQIISLFINIYFLYNDSKPITCKLYPSSYDKTDLNANVIEMFIGWIIKIICYFLPIIITLKAFWINRSIKFSSANPKDSLNLADENNFMNQLKFNKNSFTSSVDHNMLISESSLDDQPPIGGVISEISNNFKRNVQNFKKFNF